MCVQSVFVCLCLPAHVAKKDQRPNQIQCIDLNYYYLNVSNCLSVQVFDLETFREN